MMEPKADGPIRLPLDASDSELIKAAQHCVDLVAEGDYAGALALVVPGEWTPKLVRDVVNGLGLIDDGPLRQKITPVATAVARQGDIRVPCHSVTRYGSDRSDPRAEVIFQLPINGFWSDLSLQLGTRRDGHHLVLELESIHVF